jgi:hypothetical protein
MSELHIRRDMRPWGDRYIDYKVMLDGHQVGALGWGGSIVVPVQPGLHALRVEIEMSKSSIDYAGSPTVQFRLAEGENVAFACRIGHGPVFALFQGLLLWWSPLRRERWIVLERV